MNLFLGCLFAFFSVAFGAFGAHALKNSLDEYSLNIWQTAVSYQFLHALGLLVLGSLENKNQGNTVEGNWIGRFFSLGILIFSGSLYLLAVTGIKWLGAITPIGGLCFLLGWILFAHAAWKNLQIRR